MSSVLLVSKSVLLVSKVRGLEMSLAGKQKGFLGFCLSSYYLLSISLFVSLKKRNESKKTYCLYCLYKKKKEYLKKRRKREREMKSDKKRGTSPEDVARASQAHPRRGLRALRTAPLATIVAVDTETSGLHPDDGARVSCVSLAWRGGSVGLPFDQGLGDKMASRQLELGGESESEANLGEEEWRELMEWLQGRDLVMHNAKYDLTMLAKGTRDWKGVELESQLKWDTMVAASVLEPGERQGLGAVAERLGVGVKDSGAVQGWLKERKLPKGRYDLVPWSVMEPYAVGDAEVTLAVHDAQTEVGVKELHPCIARELELTKALSKMERRGVGFDAEGAIEAAEQLERRIVELEEQLPFYPTPAGAKAWFFDVQGKRVERRTPKGAAMLDAEQLRVWCGEGEEWAAEYQELNKSKKAVGMWYRGWAERTGWDGRLRAVHKQTFVKSGRMSVERVQLQAVPKRVGLDGVAEVRELIRAEEGSELWNLDLSQAELRVAAKMSGCDKMQKQLEGGADIHGEAAIEILGANAEDTDWKAKRDIAKRLTFGSIFQIGGEAFQAQLSKIADIQLERSACDRLVNEWRRTYPEYGVAYRKAEGRAQKKGSVRVLPGTEYERESVVGEGSEHTAWNRMVQGSLAEFMKLWIVAVEAKWPGRMILTVHDSVVLELPRSEGGVADKVAALGGQMATELFGTKMKVDVERWKA